MPDAKVSPNVKRGSAGDVSRNIFFTVISNTYVPLASLATAPILARCLTVDGRGEVAAATAPLVLMTFVATLGIPEAITNVRARSAKLSRRAEIAFPVTLLTAGILSTLMVIMAAPVLAGGRDDLAELIQICSTAIAPTLTVSYFRAIAAGVHRWRLVNTERYISATIRLIAIVVAAGVNFLSVNLAVLIISTAPIVGALAYIPLARKRHITAEGPLTSFRGSMGYASRVWVGSLSGIILTRVSLLVITPLASSYELGLYVAAVNVSDLSLLVNNAVRDVLFSADAAERSFTKLAQASRISFALSVLFGGFLLLTIPLWFGRLFGEEYAGGELPAVILVAGSVLGVPGSVVGAGLAARGRPGLRSAAISLGSIVTLIGLGLLVPTFGAVGAALATSLGGLIAASLNLTFAKVVFSWRTIPTVSVGRREDAVAIKRLIRRMVAKPSKAGASAGG